MVENLARANRCRVRCFGYVSRTVARCANAVSSNRQEQGSQFSLIADNIFLAKLLICDAENPVLVAVLSNIEKLWKGGWLDALQV